MRGQGHVPETLIFIITSLQVFSIIAVSGCIFSQPEGIPFSYSLDIYVVDDNGSSIVNQTTVYDFIAILDDRNFSRSSGHGMTNTTNGSSHFTGNMFPLYPGERIVFGASTNNSSLHDDWNIKRFSPGNTGHWTIITYDSIPKTADGYQNGSINVTIFVSDTTGDMISR